MTHTKQTILFHIACRNICQMSPELETEVYDQIEDWCNGDGQNPNLTKEEYLQMYWDQYGSPLPWESKAEHTWVDLVKDLVESLN